MQKECNKIIIDTNIWVSFLIKKQFSIFRELFGNHKLIFSKELLAELCDVVERRKFTNLFSNEQVRILFEFIERYAEIVEISSKVDICRDKKDNYLLALAKDSKADYLITGDNDLLVLEQFEGTKIIKIVDFML
ncbi:MAG: putative toxin-antitoxin system toxin component, PIN family [Bacteroidetes bacterium]|nr:putative toxin-antitoxin system toxin component, PIN family [Bacteroidota bacterium]